MKGILPVGCGQCLPCRINRTRLWTHRILLESRCHQFSSFVTLTYAGHSPTGSQLIPRHYVQWLKRLRKSTGGKFRYFVVGEYGDENQRAHFHAALFGYPPCPYGNYKFCPFSYCKVCRTMEKNWGHGSVAVGELARESAAYIAGYVTKKMTLVDDPRLQGRHPEFAQMSRKPGIGALAVPSIVDTLTTDGGCESIRRAGDVPLSLQHGRKSMPLGRYLRSKIRTTLGASSEEIAKAQMQKFAQEMRELLEKARFNPATAKKTARAIINEMNAQPILNMETRFKIRKARSL